MENGPRKPTGLGIPSLRSGFEAAARTSTPWQSTGLEWPCGQPSACPAYPCKASGRAGIHRKTVNDTTQNIVGYDVTYRLGEKEGTVRTSFKPDPTLPVKDGEVVTTPPGTG